MFFNLYINPDACFKDRNPPFLSGIVPEAIFPFHHSRMEALVPYFFLKCRFFAPKCKMFGNRHRSTIIDMSLLSFSIKKSSDILTYLHLPSCSICLVKMDRNLLSLYLEILGSASVNLDEILILFRYISINTSTEWFLG